MALFFVSERLSKLEEKHTAGPWSRPAISRWARQRQLWPTGEPWHSAYPQGLYSLEHPGGATEVRSRGKASVFIVKHAVGVRLAATWLLSVSLRFNAVSAYCTSCNRPLFVAIVRGHWSWPLVVAIGRGHWSWPLVVAIGRGHFSDERCVACTGGPTFSGYCAIRFPMLTTLPVALRSGNCPS
jgi:hypothetical protein